MSFVEHVNTEHYLERLKVATQGAASSYVMRHADPDLVIDEMTGNLVARLSSHVLADRLEPSSTTVTTEVYASLWQHMKGVWFPRLSALLRRPPRFKQHVFTVTASNFATFPECRMDYPSDLGRPVRVSMFNETGNWISERDWR